MLDDYRVIDLTDERGHLAAFIWAQMGADVVAVEPPGGQQARKLAPFAGETPHPERSLHHWAYNRGKRSVVLNYQGSEADRQRLLDLVAGADVLFECFEPGEGERLGLGREALAQLNPALVHVSITAFGSDGPKAGWAYSDLTIQAAANNMAITGDRDRAPLRAGGTLPQAFHNAASEAAGAALIALWERQTRSGLGQHVDVSAQQSMSQAAQSNTLAAPLNATELLRTAGGASLQGIDIQLMWPCADGYASVSLLFGLGFAHFTQNLMNWVAEEGFCDEATRTKDWVNYTMMLLDGREPVEEYERVKGCLTSFFATKTKAELLDAAMTRRVLITPVSTVEEVANSEQLAARSYFETVEIPSTVTASSVRFPGPFAKFSATPLKQLGPPPTLGEHTAEVLAEPARQPAVPAQPERDVTAAASPAQPAAAAPPATPARPTSPPTATPTDPPLAGVKVLDFMWAMAGPAASRVLADYGAEIIHVESETKLDAVRSLNPFRDDVADPELSGIYNNMAAGKRGLAIDLRHGPAREVIWDLIEWADVVMESYSPKAMRQWGFDYPALAARRPDIIMTSSCLMGQSGPLALLAGFGTMAAAISGFFNPVGWPDRAPSGPFGAYTDYTSPRWLVASVMGALEHRRRTGQGQYVDLSQAEAALHLAAPALLDYEINGNSWERAANRDLAIAPQGVYATSNPEGATAGEWIAISCVTQQQWEALAQLIGRGELAGLELAERHQRHDELDDAIASFTSGHPADALAEQLQQLGVPAHRVQNSAQLAADPQAVHREHFVEVGHAKQGTTIVEGTRFKLARTPAQITYGGPTFGEHTFEVLTETLGYDSDQIADLAAAELLT